MNEPRPPPRFNFPCLLKLALETAFKRTEAEPVKIGNVTFEMSEYAITHDIPAEQWDMPAVAADVAKELNQ